MSNNKFVVSRDAQCKHGSAIDIWRGLKKVGIPGRSIQYLYVIYFKKQFYSSQGADRYVDEVQDNLMIDALSKLRFLNAHIVSC